MGWDKDGPRAETPRRREQTDDRRRTADGGGKRIEKRGDRKEGRENKGQVRALFETNAFLFVNDHVVLGLKRERKAG